MTGGIFREASRVSGMQMSLQIMMLAVRFMVVGSDGLGVSKVIGRITLSL